MKTFSHLIDSWTFLDQFVTSSAQLLPCCQKYTQNKHEMEINKLTVVTK